MSVQMHPRTQPTNQAANDLRHALLEAEEKYDLTYGELLWILSEITMSYSAGLLRAERGERQAGE